MNAEDIINNLSGFIWNELKKIQPEDYIEPCDERLFSETILGSMNELEKALFTIRENLYEILLNIFCEDDVSDDEASEFYYAILYSNADVFSKRCDEKPEIDKVTAIEARNQFLSTYDLLKVITSQRFEINPDGVEFLYSEGFIVIMNKQSLFYVNEN